MIKQIALVIFGWKRTPEGFLPRGGELIMAYLKDHDVERIDAVPSACYLALSQLAYTRAAKDRLDRPPRFIHYMRELERMGAFVEDALRGREVDDSRVRSILLLHRVN